MPSYKVIKPGFFNSEYYHPEGKRNILHTDKPFSKKEMPSWLVEMPKESAAMKKKREEQEASRKAADIEKAKQDQKDISDASFLGAGESGNSIEDL